MLVRSFAFTAAAALLAAPASAVVVESFEAGVPGTGQSKGFQFVDSGAGITEGTQAVRRTISGGAGFEIGPVFNIDGAPAPVTEITAEVHTLDAQPNGFLQFVLGADFGDTDFAFNAQTDYVQVNGSKEPGGVGGNSFVGSGTGQFTITYTAAQNATFFNRVNAALLAGDAFDLAVVLNKADGATGTFTVDNITANIVPEPASLAVLGLGGVALLGRRRR
ncbi:PEP-CTERM sorting domain-containing protein [Phycisphaera mikurensis]|uniref:Ice-binding protein C-terminal domain-containing protein n=1 Tax=Phycisphaera mikurensis (strain NBRC 102666 / KCTC 22515 / FYK2301M01) TaxID=1142394 RepID=I0IBS5_PHYMF|nr:PEP-CTERM sorting domain-containing protein [Phycisphaera mikurensis]MBB6442056.1 hypothetical protein [Phycisphaera mikurensis]BAM02713.1 hypothetical protein PSMK_05540 [Phycisphaera mikurensis NBRC 102666]